MVKPGWIGTHLLAVLAVAACLTAGYWQFVRAQEPSREVVDNPIERLSQARPLSEALEPGAYMSESEGNQAVRATGVYDPAQQRLAPALSPEGEKGYYVVAPLVTGDDTAVAVSRGWLPEDATDSAQSVAPPPEGEVTVTGWLQPPDKAEDGYVPMDVPDGDVARIAPSLLVNQWPYRLYEGYVVRGEQSPQDPASGGSAAELREIPPPAPPAGVVWNWRNVSYAAQWVIFGIAVVVFWISLVRRALHEEGSTGDDGTGGGDGAAPASGGGAGQAPVART
ncbi:SURF1 family protein [Streptomonospora salina]